MENFKEFCFKASRLLAITIIGFFILLALPRILLSLDKILYPLEYLFEKKPDNEVKIESAIRNLFVVNFESYINELKMDKCKYYDDEVLREYIEKKLDIVEKHYRWNYSWSYDRVLLAIKDLEDLEYEYKEKLLDSDEVIKIFKFEFKFKLRERKKNLE